MNRTGTTTAAGLLLAGSSLLVLVSDVQFIAFGTMLEPGASYGSGNLYLGMLPTLGWTLAIFAGAMLLSLGFRQSHQDTLASKLTGPSQWTFVGVLLCWIFVVGQLIAWLLYDWHPRDVDHVARVFQARTFATGGLTVEAPPLPEFFEIFAVLVHDGEMFSKYGPGGALFYVLPEWLFGRSHLINPLLGALAALFSYLSIRHWFDERTARLWLLCAALSPWYLFMIASLHSHVPAMFLFSVILFCFSRVDKERGFCRPLIIAGFTGGLFMLTREYTAVLLCLPLVLAYLFTAPARATARLLALSAGVSGPLICFLLYNQRLTGDPLLFPHLLADPEQVPWFGYKGHTPMQGLVHLWESLRLINLNLLGWPVSLALLPFAFLHPSQVLRIAGLCVLLLAAGYFANYWMDYSLGARYYFEPIPLLLLFVAVGFWQIHDRLPSSSLVVNARTLTHFALLAWVFSAVVYLPRLIELYGNHYNGNVHTRVAELAATRTGSNALIFMAPVGGENGGYASGFLANPLDLARISRDAMAAGADTSQQRIYARDLGARNGELAARFPGRETWRFTFDLETETGNFEQLFLDN
jgi:hypothetical protein